MAQGIQVRPPGPLDSLRVGEQNAAMSIKRTKEVSRRRTPDFDDSGRRKEPERVYTWDGDIAPHLAEPIVGYLPAHKYAKDTLLMHKVFGVGIVTKVEGTKLEILFKDGAKKLAHNPAGTPPPAPDAAAPAPVAAAPAPAPEPTPEPAPAVAADPEKPA